MDKLLYAVNATFNGTDRHLGSTARDIMSNLFAGPESGRFVNWRFQMSNSVGMIDQCRVDELLVVLLVEELTSNHQPHARHHVVLYKTGDRRAIFRHQILQVCTGCNQQANQWPPAVQHMRITCCQFYSHSTENRCIYRMKITRFN